MCLKWPICSEPEFQKKNPREKKNIIIMILISNPFIVQKLKVVAMLHFWTQDRSFTQTRKMNLKKCYRNEKSNKLLKNWIKKKILRKLKMKNNLNIALYRSKKLTNSKLPTLLYQINCVWSCMNKKIPVKQTIFY